MIARLAAVIETLDGVSADLDYDDWCAAQVGRAADTLADIRLELDRAELRSGSSRLPSFSYRHLLWPSGL